jgi:hypothetical protein
MDEEDAVIEGAPHALAMYFARENEKREDAEIAQMDMLDWLSAKISDRVSASPSQRTKEACLAFPSFSKRLVEIGIKDRMMNTSGC